MRVLVLGAAVSGRAAAGLAQRLGHDVAVYDRRADSLVELGDGYDVHVGDWRTEMLAGVDYVTANASEIEVANMSLTGDGIFQSLDDAIDGAIAAGVVFTLAAGNDSKDVSLVFPAGHPGSITVSALDALVKVNVIDGTVVKEAIDKFGINPDKPDPILL